MVLEYMDGGSLRNIINIFKSKYEEKTPLLINEKILANISF